MKISWWSLLPFLHNIEMERMDKYLTMMTGFINSEKDEFDRKLVEATKGMSQDDGNQYFEACSDEWLDLSEGFPNLLCKSMIITIWTAFEREMLLTCWHQIRRDEMKKQSKLVIGKIEAEKSITHVADVERYWGFKNVRFPADGWKEVDNIRRVRNVIAHQGGSTIDGNDESKAVIRYAGSRSRSGKKGLVVENDEVKLTPDFCREALKTTNGFLWTVVETIEKAGFS